MTTMPMRRPQASTAIDEQDKPFQSIRSRRGVTGNEAGGNLDGLSVGAERAHRQSERRPDSGSGESSSGSHGATSSWSRPSALGV